MKIIIPVALFTCGLGIAFENPIGGLALCILAVIISKALMAGEKTRR